MVESIVALPITSLTGHSKYVLSCLLNPHKLFLSNGLPRDWRGLAGLLGISSEIANSIKDSKEDKTAKVIDLWVKKNDGTALIGRLLHYLERLDRFDIYDDLNTFFRNGVLLEKDQIMEIVPALPTPENQHEIITFDDQIYGTPQMYHAYVLYASEESEFADELISRMRSLNCKICTKNEVLPGYTTQYVPVSQILMERCKQIIVIYSESFFKNPTNVFFLNYAQAVSIEIAGDRKPKLLPCMYGDSTRTRQMMPENLQYYFYLHYDPTEEKPIYDFWEKLAITLGVMPRSINQNLPRINGTSSSMSSLKVKEMTPSHTNEINSSWYKPGPSRSVCLPITESLNSKLKITTVSELIPTSSVNNIDNSIRENGSAEKSALKKIIDGLSISYLKTLKKKSKAKKKLMVAN